MAKKLFLPLWVLGAILLFLYSYTQVDLSLTLSRASIFQTIEKSFQYVGWFNRPLSTVLFVGILIYLFSLYAFSVRWVLQNKVSRKTIWSTVLIVTGILTLSYNAFSYDIFNYIFDAKIVTFYHLSPYTHKALDFPQDPMLSFMRWTHRVYPYGPMWLALTVPLSFIGGNIFIVTFFLFKILMGGAFLLAVWSIEKISVYLKHPQKLIAMVVFALNPLVLIESLVSAHNDIVMMGLALVGVYYFLRPQKVAGSAVFLLSFGVKYVTVLLPIAYLVLSFLKKTKHFIFVSLLLMLLGVLLATLRTNFQPWYLLYALPFASLLFQKKSIRLPIFIVSIAGLATYIPFLYTGNWNPPIPFILNIIVISAAVFSLVVLLVQLAYEKK